MRPRVYPANGAVGALIAGDGRSFLVGVNFGGAKVNSSAHFLETGLDRVKQEQELRRFQSFAPAFVQTSVLVETVNELSAFARIGPAVQVRQSGGGEAARVAIGEHLRVRWISQCLAPIGFALVFAA